MARTIQRGIYPSIDLCPEIVMFFRFNAQAIIDINCHMLILFTNGIVDTSTYFNSISVEKWKRHTNIDQLFFRIEYRGTLKLTFKISEIAHGTRVIYEQVLHSDDWHQTDIELPFWSTIQSGMLYFEIYAMATSCVRSFSYMTHVKALKAIKLGIVITHYNRQQYIIPAIKRLQTCLLAAEEYRSKVALVIVDNSQNLPNIEGITIIRNNNLGGAGGFSRGLIYLKNNPQFTHCLFMDDDASCEVEAISRTIVLLESAQDPKLAISGAMLTEKEVYRQYECGAYFDGTCHSVDKGLNLLYEHNLLHNERPKRIEYGAWWFFAFALQGVQYNAFPYFVRGDDISFSYANQFKVETMNGICSWQPDFSNKSSPQSVYLDVRNHLMHPLHGLIKGYPWWILMKSAVLLYAYQVVSYYYDSAQAVNIAIEDVLKGPDFWRDNVDMIAKRKQINSIITTEKLVPIPQNMHFNNVRSKIEMQMSISNVRKSTLTSLIRYLTLNGHLLPTMIFHKGFTAVKKSSGSRMANSFRYKTVIVIVDKGNQCYVLTHNKKKFFSCSCRFIYLLGKLLINYKKLMKAYMKTYPELTSDKFWQEQYQK